MNEMDLYLKNRQALIDGHAYDPRPSATPAASAWSAPSTASRAAKSSNWRSRP
jgi:hypothetical protein